MLFVAWVAYAVVSTLWLHLLLWTVLPTGLALYLFVERYPWPVIVIFVAPLTLLTAFAQVVATWTDTPLWISFAIYLIACAYFSVVLSDPNRDGWTARLPGWLLGERFSARLAWARFESSLVAANALVRQTNAGEDQAGRHAALDRLVTQARRESGRDRTWREAWAAHAAWLEGLDTLVGIQPWPTSSAASTTWSQDRAEHTCGPSSKRLSWIRPHVDGAACFAGTRVVDELTEMATVSLA